MGKGVGSGGKGSAFHDDWWERATEMSPSIPSAIHDENMPESGDDEFSKLCKDIKRGFDNTVGKK